jgi:hypothetical protein
MSSGLENVADPPWWTNLPIGVRTKEFSREALSVALAALAPELAVCTPRLALLPAYTPSV